MAKGRAPRVAGLFVKAEPGCRGCSSRRWFFLSTALRQELLEPELGRGGVAAAWDVHTRSGALVRVPAPLPLTQLPADASRTAADDSLSTWGPATHAGDLDGGSRPLALAWPSPGYFMHLGSEPADR